MFKSLHHILDVIENQPGWETQQQFRLILAQWSGVVGATVAAHTRPTGIDRSVLWVATSSPIWAQELTFKRHLILSKLSEKLKDLLGNSMDPKSTQSNQSINIKNIRFSSGQWQPRFDDASPVMANHPSYLPPKINQSLAPSLPVSNTDTSSKSNKSNKFDRSDRSDRLDKSPHAVKSIVNAQAWWQQVQDRSSHLPLCGQCQCPTPPGEIDRWGCCALCATKKWSR